MIGPRRWLAAIALALTALCGSVGAVPDVLAGQPHAGAVAVPAGDPDLPIVFVRGFDGLRVPGPGPCAPAQADVFGPVGAALAAAGHHVAFTAIDSTPCGTPPIEEHVTALRETIDGARTATGHERVVLITHSMGGLVARAYVEGPAYGGDVAALYTLGTPHQGMPLDVLVFLLNGTSLGAFCSVQPAACDMTTLGMALFNRRHTDRTPGVEYHVISGDAPGGARNLTGRLAGWLIPGPDDGIVPTSSGVGLGGAVDRLVTGEVHGTVLGPSSYFDDRGAASASYRTCLEPLLVSGTRERCGSGTDGRAAGSLPVTDMPVDSALGSQRPGAAVEDAEVAWGAGRSPFAFGTLLPGRTAVEPFVVDGGPLRLAATWSEGDVRPTLVDPAGRAFAPTSVEAAAGWSSAAPMLSLRGGGVALFELLHAVPGIWHLELAADRVPDEGARYGAFAAFARGPVLEVAPDRDESRPGEAVRLRVRVHGPVGSADMLASGGVPGKQPRAMTLEPAGPGRFESVWVPEATGISAIEITVRGTTESGAPFARAAHVALRVLGPSVTDALAWPAGLGDMERARP